MLPVSRLHLDLRSALDAMARRPLHELLDQHGLLQALARDLALKALREDVRFTEEERQAVLSRVCAGLPCPAPSSLEGDWIATLPEDLRDTVRQRWDHLRHQKALEDRYGERVEAHFLERRADLEQVVFRLLRLPQQGLAEELYLRLVDDGAGFGELASRYSIGDESITRGIVGPIELSQLNPTLRGVLGSLAVGDIHPPFLLEQAILVVRLEHRRPASLSEDLRHRLLEELLQPDLHSCIEAVLAELRHSLAAEQAPLAAVPAPALAVAGG